MKKQKKKHSTSFVLISILSIGLLTVLSLALVLTANCCWMTANMASILGGVLSAVATTILGAIAIWQNIEYKRLSEISEQKTFKAQVLSACPYFSINECEIDKEVSGNYVFKINLTNIGKSLATCVLPYEFEFSNLGYFYGKTNSNVINTVYSIDYANISPNDSFTFNSEPMDIKFSNCNDTYFAYIVISIVAHNQIQFDQQIQLEFGLINNELKYITQHQSQFLNLYNI